MKYDIYNIPDPKHPGEQLQHIRPISWGVLTHDELVEMMCSHNSGLDRGTVVACLCKLGSVLSEAMADGKKPQIDGIGTFSLQLKKKESSSVTDLEKVRANGVEVKTVTFQPSAKFLYSIDRQSRYEKSDMTNRSHKRSLDELEAIVNDYFACHDHLTRHQFQRIAGLTESTARRRINELERKGLIRNLGDRYHPIYAKGEENA